METKALVYTFSYRDEEHDIYENEFDCLQDALTAIKILQNEGNQVIETWIHKEDGTFIKRFNF